MSSSKDYQIWSAAEVGNLEVVTNLLAVDPAVNHNGAAVNVNWIGPEKGDTPLHRACRFGHVQVVKVLLEHPVIDVNAGNAGRATPLNIASQEGHVEVVKLLLADTRVDLNSPSGDGTTPFSKACQEGYVEVVSLLLAKK